jgi:hypothetical protein
VGKPTGTQLPVTTPVSSVTPPKEGTLQVLDTLNLQEPETGHKVFASPPEYIRVKMGEAEYRVKPGQDFLNTGTSARYKAEPAAIKGSKAQLKRPMLDKSGGEAPDDVRVIGDGHHRFIWGAFAGLPVAAESKSLPMIANPWSDLTYKDAPGVEPAVKPAVKPPVKPPVKGPSKAVKTPAKTETGEGTEKTAATEKVWPSMGRIENPEWSRIEPLLPGYGITTEDDKRKIKAALEENLKDTENSKPIRGITDLIGRALGGDRQTAAARFVRQQNAAAAPDLTGKVMSVGRGDTRPPYSIREDGGLYGWAQGVVSLAHARQIATTVLAMPVAQQKAWITSWKWPTPSPAEGNPWVATGRGKEGGQKGRSGEFYADVPLIPEKATSGFQMIVLTDTGDIASANVIGVQLHLPGGGDTEEVIMLTGIPWKYITGWWGKIEGQNAEQPKRWAKDTAADLTKPRPKK